jgi:hypothetical protein
MAKTPITLRLVPTIVWGRENFQKAFSQGNGVLNRLSLDEDWGGVREKLEPMGLGRFLNQDIGLHNQGLEFSGAIAIPILCKLIQRWAW